MKYLCLCYGEPTRLEARPMIELDELIVEQVAYAEVLGQDGRSSASEALEPVGSAITVRVRDGKLSVTDGPLVETREPLSGFFLVEARDLNDAIRVASRFPSARSGSIEVRPIWEIRAATGESRIPASRG